MHQGWFRINVDMAEMRDAVMTPAIAGASTANLARSRMAVPAEVRLGPDRLEWKLDWKAGAVWAEGEPASGALWAFIDLATETDGERFVDVARRYGVLSLIPSGVPSVGRAKTSQDLPDRLEDGGFWEPIAAWRTYAANAKAVMHLAVALRGGGRINAKRVLGEAALEADPWAGVRDIPPPTWGDDQTKTRYNMALASRLPATLAQNLDELERDHASQRQWLAWYVTHYWLAASALVPVLDWTDDRPRLALPIGASPDGVQDRFWPPNMLFNILAAHLAAFICSGNPVGVCGICGKLHPRERQPRTDQPSYCDDCQPRAKSERQKRWRANQRGN